MATSATILTFATNELERYHQPGLTRRAVAPAIDSARIIHVWACTKYGVTFLRPRLDLIKHCPEGFRWGNTGSGSAQLALALLAPWSGSDEFALRNYQDFKFAVVAHLPT